MATRTGETAEMLLSKPLRAELLLLLAAVIWGFAFVAQRVGMEHVGPFTYNGVRFVLGALSLLPLLWLGRRSAAPLGPGGWRPILGGGLLAGLILFAGASLQQVGIVHTTAGKAGFITGLYVVIVPVLGLLWGHRTPWSTWTGAALAVAGLYLLTLTDAFTLAEGDGLVLVGAFFWAGHVLVIGWLSGRHVEPILLACLQFIVCAVLSLAVAAATEPITASGLRGGALPILYGGLLSVGIAYTLQVVAQRDAAPAHAAIILSLETGFAALGGWLLLNETLSGRGLIGCALMFAGMLLSQLGLGKAAPPPTEPAVVPDPAPVVGEDRQTIFHRTRQNRQSNESK
jgi:drug/metabolite transporter (DMT)-like permease